MTAEAELRLIGLEPQYTDDTVRLMAGIAIATQERLVQVGDALAGLGVAALALTALLEARSLFELRPGRSRDDPED